MTEVNLLSAGTWFQPGPATLIVRTSGWIVLVPGARKELIEAAWTVLADPPAPRSLIGRLAELAGLDGPDAISSVLFALLEGSTAHVGVKGTTPLAVYTADGGEQILGTADDPLVIREVADCLRVAFGDLPAEDPVGGLRVESGMVRVRGFVHMLVDPSSLEEPARDALRTAVEADGRSIESPEQKKRKAAAAASRPAPVAPPAPSAGPSKQRTPPTAAPRRPLTAQRDPGVRPGQAAASSQPTAPAGPSVFDGLFGGSSASDPAASSAGKSAGSASSAASGGPSSAPSTGGAPTEQQPAAAPQTAAPAPSPAAEPGPAAEPEPAPAVEPEPAAASEAQPTSAAPRRRLVSSSLFDRASARRAFPPQPAPPDPAAEAVPAAEMVPSPEPTADGAPAPQPAPSSAPESASESASSPAPAPAPAPASQPQPSPVSAPTPAPVPSPVSTPTPAEPPGASEPSPTPEPPATPGAYDDLFGETVFRSVADAAVRPRAEDDEPSAAEEPASTVTAPPESSRTAEPDAPSALTPPEPVTADAASSAIGGDFIDWVPGVGRAAPEIADTAARRAAAAPGAVPSIPSPPAPAWGQGTAPGPVPAPAQTPGPRTAAPSPAAQQGPPAAQGPSAAWSSPAAQGPSAARGSSTAQAPSRASGPPPMPSPPSAPGPEPAAGPRPFSPARPAERGAAATAEVVGQLCPSGHANPPERSSCRCGAPLDGRTRSVTRPVLGRVAISTGGEILLDRTAVIGRRPRASRVSGHDVPQLVTVPSPQQDISRSHVELRLEGWLVIATDLGTTNGTTVHRAGQEPLRMRPREGVVLHDGDRIDLGDGVVLTLRGLP